MTTSRRWTSRTKDRESRQVIDARAKAVLHALSLEPKGRALTHYLRVFRTN